VPTPPTQVAYMWGRRETSRKSNSGHPASSLVTTHTELRGISSGQVCSKSKTDHLMRGAPQRPFCTDTQEGYVMLNGT